MIKVFRYELPADRIAQRPVSPYHDAKLLVVNRKAQALSDSKFMNLPELLRAGDLIVFNDSKVIPARLFGEFETSGGKVELLLLEEDKSDSSMWRALGKPMRKFSEGKRIRFAQDLIATILKREGENEALISFESASSDIPGLLKALGAMPIPPYIRGGISDEIDIKDYQTPFGKNEGSVAAPTASLHFSPQLMQALKDKGVSFEYLTLHLGTASFLPLTGSDELTENLKPPNSERISFSSELKEKIKVTRVNSGRVVAVGTSVVRALESIELDTIENDRTSLFIKPGHKFQNVDIAVTNFHQPGTSHLLLVEALLGRSLLEKSYRHALDNNYRFLSYGDGMVILP